MPPKCTLQYRSQLPDLLKQKEGHDRTSMLWG